MNARRCIDTTVLIACLFFLSSCAAQSGGKVELPVETSTNSKAGEPLVATVHLENGQKLLVLVDTGTHESILDKSLEPSLGKPLGKMYVKIDADKSSLTSRQAAGPQPSP